MYVKFTISCSHFHQLSFEDQQVKVRANSNTIGQELINVRPIRSPSHPKLGLSLPRKQRSHEGTFSRNKRHPNYISNFIFFLCIFLEEGDHIPLLSWFHQQFSDIIMDFLHINSPSNWHRGISRPWVVCIPSVSDWSESIS